MLDWTVQIRNAQRLTSQVSQLSQWGTDFATHFIVLYLKQVDKRLFGKMWDTDKCDVFVWHMVIPSLFSIECSYSRL